MKVSDLINVLGSFDSNKDIWIIDLYGVASSPNIRFIKRSDHFFSPGSAGDVGIFINDD